MPISTLVARLRSVWRGVFHRGDIEAEMAEEFRHHLELRTEDLIRDGLAPGEAARQARIEFGHVDNYRDDARASRGLWLFDEIRFSSLDVKLGLRMLMKYPGLSLVSVVGMSVAIAIGAGGFAIINAMMDPALPLDEGDRVVSLQNANANDPGNPDRQSLHDFVQWRDELASVTDLGAFTADRRNLVIPGGGVALVRVAQMTASGFRVARAQPVLGRPLLDEDEAEGAPPVVLIAYEEWQRRFAADPEIVGRQVRLGTAIHTVVGVMPEGFRFPISYRYWIPLRLNPADYERGGGPSLTMFGRLADGVSLRAAQAELTTVGLRSADLYPATHGHLRPRVLPYTHDFVDIDSPAVALAMRAVQLTISLLLVVVAVNVAILVYARTATRAGEIAVRSALGASRRRVVAQLFVEGLVLSGAAAVIGLTMAGVALTEIMTFQKRAYAGEFPFWLDVGLSPELIAYVAGLTILAGIIVGVLPALRATGRRVQEGLKRLTTHRSGMQLGRTWTALIVAQVAVAVAVLPTAVYIAGTSVRRGTAEPDYAPRQYLRARLFMERVEAPPSAGAAEYEREIETRFRRRTAELLSRLEAEPWVSGVTFASSFPGAGRYHRIEIDNTGTGTKNPSQELSSGPSAEVLSNDVDADLFSVFDVPILAGRSFVGGDANAVIVDQTFAQRVLDGKDVVGRNLRFLRRVAKDGFVEIEKGPWLEVVGVVPDFTVQYDFDPLDPQVYLPLDLAQARTDLTLVVRARDGTSPVFAQRVREIAAAVDPALQLYKLRSAADEQLQAQQAMFGLALIIVGVTVSVLLLSAAGIYAMTSFTVARRRREIGIRTALGADPRRVLSGIFARASAQLGAGLGIGLAVAVAFDRAVGGGLLEGDGIVLLPVVAALMMAIGLAAALGPARRGLAVQPTEVLHDE